MTCPECKSNILTLVETSIEYVDEPYTFPDGNFVHVHDSNTRVTIWKCDNGHEFPLKGKMRCNGCLLEQAEATRLAQEASMNQGRMRGTHPLTYNNDHHQGGFFSGGPGPSTT